ncbi:hypothetical protein [Methanosarcina barkeri]|nr:hypothetical protein [Methanosarcina barkeri]
MAASFASAPLFVKNTLVRLGGRISTSKDSRRARAGEYVSPELGF